LTYDEIAAALATLVGRPVTYEALAPERFRAGLLDAGIPEWRADDLAAIGAAYTAADNVPSEDLTTLLGRPATPFGRFLTDHRETYLAGASRSHL
jgi:NAD(P)H dehydrogenase (quinone)